MQNRKAALSIVFILLALILLAGYGKISGKVGSEAAPLSVDRGMQVSESQDRARTSNEASITVDPRPAGINKEMPGNPSPISEKSPAKAKAINDTGDPPTVNKAVAAEPASAATGSRVRLVVTRDFGQTLLSDCWVPLDKPVSALEVTTARLTTKTAYGGTFIVSINGLASGYTDKAVWNRKKEDWFLYYNGKIAAAGANNIMLRDGDMIWWDYHDWSGEQKPLPAAPPGQ